MSAACVLFDLDLTLMVSDGAGSAAMRRAFEPETGVTDPLDGIAFHGRTDRWIVSEVARRLGMESERLWTRYRHDYPLLLRDELAKRNPYVLPGVIALLDALEARRDVSFGLATGNQREASFLKLASVGLERYFDRGGFGDRHERRADMLREAIAEIGMAPGARLVVVGDSEHDMAAAAEVGALAVGVATGRRTIEELTAAGAGAALPGLDDLDASLAALLG